MSAVEGVNGWQSFLSLPPFGEGLSIFVRVRLFVCISYVQYPVVAPKTLVEKFNVQYMKPT